MGERECERECEREKSDTLQYHIWGTKPSRKLFTAGRSFFQLLIGIVRVLSKLYRKYGKIGNSYRFLD